jgi:Domain of unknown function (DUF4260)
MEAGSCSLFCFWCLMYRFSEGNGRFAAAFYNAFHCCAVPLGVALIAWRLHSVVTERITVIWVAHIALDRFIGFGLKYAQAANPTHMQSVRFHRPL